MSLHDAAQHLAAQGRGPDDQLIHMSSKEIAGLQALAKSAGGSLTINPETGLAEAGFLDSLLPTLIGAGLAYATGGTSLAMTPGMVGLGVGGLEAVRTGDLGKGLMAGLGAYGGAGMLGAAGQAGMLSGAETAVPPAPNLVGPTALHPNMIGPDTSPIFSDAIGADTEQLVSSLPKGNALVNPLAQPVPTMGDLIMQNKGFAAAAAAPTIMDALQPKGTGPAASNQMIRPYTFAPNAQRPQNMVGTTYRPGQDTSERMWFQPQFTALPPYKAAEGGLMDLQSMAAGGGPVEQMSDNAALGTNTMYPMANMTTSAFSTPYQDPRSTSIIAPSVGPSVNQMTGELNPQGTRLAGGGGISTLGGYAAGGNPRLLKGPGDGMSDNIPAMIGAKQPARLADGEFVVPADVVSHLGNGSTDAGAKQLYKMMDRIRQQRTGKKKQAPEVNPGKAMPA